MPASFLHGVEVIETTTGPAPITVVKSSVIGLVGTAPVWNVQTPASAPATNVPTLVGSALDATNFGAMVQGYTIPYALNAILQQGAGQVIVINVFDPTLHATYLILSGTFSAAGAINLGHMGIGTLAVLPTTTTSETGEVHTFGGSPATIQLNHANVVSATVVVTSDPSGTTYVQGTDYSINAVTGLVSRLAGGAIGETEEVLVNYSYYSGTPYLAGHDYDMDPINGIVTLISGGAIAVGATVAVSFSYGDPGKVQDSDIVGAVTNGNYSGLQGLLTTFGTMGFFAKVLIAPGYSQNADVADAMLALAGQIRGMALIDSPPSTTPANAIANRGAAGNAFDTSSTRAILCYPQEMFYDTGLVPTGVTLNGTTPVQEVANQNAVGPYSQWVAGAIAYQDLQNGYWWSPSNTEVSGILGPDVTLYASLLDASSDSNNLNANGIMTVFNAFGTGLRVWGNRSAGFPTITTPDNFISIRRTMDVIEESVELAMLQFMDQPITNGLITAILATVNAFLRSLIQRGALVAGTASFNPAENPPSQIAAGQLVFDIDVMPPPPAERLTFNVYIDSTLLSQLGNTSAVTGTAANA
ncbi:MAG TPA: phage tail sheath subtilisin-like domain-containing protein [Candidatus Binataceae bacterium]|nr:phage tail sheath subtilisin-like domain-containing protein [Candidatus Binataceae bacterium]